MKKQYKIQLPKGKKVTMTNVNFEKGVMTVNVELENRKEQKYEPKDGDFVYVKAVYEHIAIFKNIKRDDFNVYAECNEITTNYNCENPTIPICHIKDVREVRPATEEEKKLLIEKLAEVGKRWNEEKRCLEDVRWRAKDGEHYSYLLLGDTDILVTTTTDMRTYKDDERFNSGNYFKTDSDAMNVAEQIMEIFNNSKAN